MMILGGPSAVSDKIFSVKLFAHFIDVGQGGQWRGNQTLGWKNEIVISHQNERNHQLKTQNHEYAHYLLHQKGAQFEKESREIKKAQAESIAYVFGKYFGLNTDGCSFGYLDAVNFKREVEARTRWA